LRRPADTVRRMWKIESFDDLQPHLYTGKLEDDGPKPFLWLSKEQFLLLRDFVIEQPHSMVIVNQGSGYKEVIMLDAENEIVDRTNIPAN
jgi:hypothetical protein